MTNGKLDGYRLEWLTSFLAVVDFGGFAVAAENTFRAQSRISSHVAELEKQLGAVLFDRRERPVRLTEAGVAFLEHARRTLASLQAGVSSVQAVLGLLRGTVRLGWYPSAGAAFGPGLLRAFGNAYPGVTISLLEVSTLELTTALQSGETDAAIRPLLPAPQDGNLQHYRLWEEPLVAILPEGHPLAESEYLPVFALADDPIVTIGGPHSDADSQHEIHRAFVTAGITPHIVYRTNEPQTLIGLVREGLGLGVTNLLAATVSNTAGTTIVPLRDSGNRRNVGVFWDAARPMQPATRALIDTIVQLPPPGAVQRFQRRA